MAILIVYIILEVVQCISFVDKLPVLYQAILGSGLAVYFTY